MKKFFLCLLLSVGVALSADNQTPTTTSVITDDVLPFEVTIRRASFTLPNGWQSGVFATYDGKWLLLAGRTNGMHGFNNDDCNFPPQTQNDVVFVVDPKKKRVFARSLQDGSGLSQEEIDSLSVTASQFQQSGKTLYVVGGYGVTTSTGQFSTMPLLTAIDVPKMIDWVEKHSSKHISIRQISNPEFQVTGGKMAQIGDGPTLLVFGQNFNGFYRAGSIGRYTKEVRRFCIHDDGKKLSVKVLSPHPSHRDPSFRRRDLNIVRVFSRDKGESLVAFSGVFTETDGIWTVPVEISSSGKTKMANPSKNKTFKQGMNNYLSATSGLYSEKHDAMYTLFFGGLSFGYFQNGKFVTDSEIPFINQVTAIKINKHHHYKQYLLPTEYPHMVSEHSNPGNTLLFGAEAEFILEEGIDTFGEKVIQLDKIKKRTRIGYIVGGIQSTLANTNTMADSAASQYIFEVFVKPRDTHKS